MQYKISQMYYKLLMKVIKTMHYTIYSRMNALTIRDNKNMGNYTYIP